MRRALVFLTITFLVVAAAGMSGSREAAAGNELVVSAASQKVVDLINVERAKGGLAALAISGPLTASANAYANHMATANFFSHVGPDGSTLSSRNEAAGYKPWTWLGENLAAGQATPESVVAAWMASPGHRANILAPNPKETGVGYVAGGSYRHYWVQEFGASPVSFGQQKMQVVAEQARVPSLPPVPSWTSPATGRTVFGEWFAYLNANGGIDNLGHPLTEVIVDPATRGQMVQFFQRAILELHPENPPAYRIQRRLLADTLYPGADAPVDPGNAPPGPSQYFPFSPDRPTGLGHFVADFTRTRQAVFFKEYFDSHGGVIAFGYPKEEPKLRGGLWTQRFQAAVFEYHPENDREGIVPGTDVPYRNYRVQLALLGDEYVASKGLVLK